MKKTNGGAARWWSEDKGFYMILLLCVLAVAVAAYVLFVSPQTEQTDPLDGYMYEAEDSVTASEPIDHVPAMDSTPQTDTEQVDETAEEEPAAETSGEVQEPAEEEAEQTTAALTFTIPIERDVTRAYSGDTLEYDETTRDWRTHDAADYGGEQGDAVCAIADGTVTLVGDDTIYGKYVVLSHAQGMNSLYAGLDEISVKEGDSVSGGKQIAVLGDPMPLEAEQGVHLHLAVTKDGEPVDPAGLF
ncbi:MAG: M23 family metallopeptidase [Eubacteriales bacterium]|nr:M23 family metallopeptidase [Eubacteriales bacterium]